MPGGAMDEKPHVHKTLRAVTRITRTHFELERAAHALATHQGVHTALVVVVRPGDPDATIVAANEFSKMRAAFRVAAAAGNPRAWRNLTERPDRVSIDALPGVIHLAAKEARMRTCHAAGLFADDGELDAAVFWFSRRERASAADVAGRAEALRLLAATLA